MNVLDVCRQFPAVGHASGAVPLERGHIHRGWVVSGSHRRWVVQACNTTVFPDMGAVMSNTAIVCAAASPGLAPATTADGSLLWTDDDGTVWRARPYVEGGVVDAAQIRPDVALELGRGLGVWHRHAATVDPGRLAVTLAGFHDPANRLAALDRLGPAEGLAPFRWIAAEWRRLEPPSVPRRVCHFDAKADNFVMAANGRVKALVDLDTVMPGAWAWDVGDLVRSAAATRAEDDPVGMAFDLDRFAAVVDGYVAGAGSLLTTAERSVLPFAAMAVTFEQAVRFVTDHLAGDVYYRVDRPGHNLDRYRAQLALLDSMVAALC